MAISYYNTYMNSKKRFNFIQKKINIYIENSLYLAVILQMLNLENLPLFGVQAVLSTEGSQILQGFVPSMSPDL